MNLPIASLMSLLLLGGCAAAPDTAAPAAPAAGEVVGVRDGSVTLAVGQSLAIGLESNATTGYHWQVSDFDTDVLGRGHPFGQEFTHPSAPGMVGVGGVTQWRFTAVGPGLITLRFAYGRSWAPDAPPAETATYRVIVR